MDQQSDIPIIPSRSSTPSTLIIDDIVVFLTFPMPSLYSSALCPPTTTPTSVNDHHLHQPYPSAVIKSEEEADNDPTSSLNSTGAYMVVKLKLSKLTLEPDSINKPFFMVVLFVDNRDGTYTGFYMAMNVGTYKICASFDGMSISPCPFEVATYNREYFPIAYGLDVSVWEDESIVFNALLQSYQLPKHKHQNGSLLAGTLLAVSPVSLVMAPMGVAQNATKELLDSIIDVIVRIFENNVVVGELLESKSSQKAPMNTPKSMVTEISGNPDSESSKDTGGYTIGFSMTVLQLDLQIRLLQKKRGIRQKMALHSPFASLMLQYPAKIRKKLL
ncbi:unnamed protein product [Lactuca virosa]|uniref:Exocyst complex component Sec8 n=1 Tax=Lactuca virosa TaxID=75947 RepID=A0AAU9PXN6_9ASTR|nr:unnamed protein product [Lactuca virosa]